MAKMKIKCKKLPSKSKSKIKASCTANFSISEKEIQSIKELGKSLKARIN